MKQAITVGLTALVVLSLFGVFTVQTANAAGYGTRKEVHKGVTCRTWETASKTYPADNAHYWVCATASETVNPQRADLIASTVEGWQSTGVNAFFMNHNVYYYYFQTRADTNSFMSDKFGGRAGQTVSDTARCGNTAIPHGGSSLIISEIYETCNYGGKLGTGQNPDLGKVTAHESGHAFDFALGRANGTKGLSGYSA